jgi:hypothetical protein
MRLKLGFVKLFVLFFIFLPCYYIYGGTGEIFAYVKTDEFLHFGVKGELSFGKFLFGGNFGYSDFGEFTNYLTVNDEFYYLLETTRVNRLYGNVRFGYDFGEILLALEVGGEYYSELARELIWECGFEGNFRVFDFLDTFLKVYNDDLMFGDWGYRVGFSVSTSRLGYVFVDSLSFYTDKKLLYNYLVSNVWVSFKVFDVDSFKWVLDFLYRFAFGFEVVDPLHLGMNLKMGSFVVRYEMILPFYFWGNYVSIGCVF